MLSNNKAEVFSRGIIAGAIVLFAVSCGNKPDDDALAVVKGKNNSDIADAMQNTTLPSDAVAGCRTNNVGLPVASTPSHTKSYDAEFLHLVGTNNLPGGASFAAVELCADIVKSQDNETARRLLEQLMDMAAKQQLAEISSSKVKYGLITPRPKNSNAEYGVRPCYRQRGNHMVRLWTITRTAFDSSQSLQPAHFAEWDRVFAFFSKWTDEISDVEKSLSARASSGSVLWQSSGEEYLHGLKVNLEQAIHEMRDTGIIGETFGSNRKWLGEGLSKEQKADLSRRFSEVERYTVLPLKTPMGEPCP